MGVVSVAAAALVALLGGKAVERSPRGRRSDALSALRGGHHRLRGTSVAAAWLTVRLLVRSARLQLPSADPLASPLLAMGRVRAGCVAARPGSRVRAMVQSGQQFSRSFTGRTIRPEPEAAQGEVAAE